MKPTRRSILVGLGGFIGGVMFATTARFGYNYFGHSKNPAQTSKPKIQIDGNWVLTESDRKAIATMSTHQN